MALSIRGHNYRFQRPDFDPPEPALGVPSVPAVYGCLPLTKFPRRYVSEDDRLPVALKFQGINFKALSKSRRQSSAPLLLPILVRFRLSTQHDAAHQRRAAIL